MSRTLADFRMDRKLLLLINRQWTGPALDRVMAVFSSTDFWAPLFLLAGLLILWRGGFHLRAALLVAVLAAGVSDGVVCNGLKHLVGRPRPHQAMSDIRMVDLAKATPRLLALAKPVKVTLSVADPEAAVRRSFPSGHTSNTTAVVVVLALFLRRAWLLFPVPLLVGYSRIYTGAHWPSDVLASLFLGLLIALLCTWGATALWRRCAPRRLPRLATLHPHLLPA
jgi:undecaprenyl-diphosphatase